MTKRREPLRFGRVVGVGQRPRVNSVAVQDDGRGETVIQISEPSLPRRVREPCLGSLNRRLKILGILTEVRATSHVQGFYTPRLSKQSPICNSKKMREKQVYT
jgi:hypothetical protein